ncbi:MAG: hypothetical protein M0Q42_06050 [Xanthomonadales bacterium]|nr:hypothetical protein [Xanthomonadales bacterium]
MTFQHSNHLPLSPPMPVDRVAAPEPSGYRDGERRQRQPGTGYGKSSGYARSHHYADQRDRPLFRCG